jgi:hypothetical protein
MAEVECPRCAYRRSARLHAIVASDSQACPRCLGLDRIEIPMFVVLDDPDRHERSGQDELPPRAA